MSKAINIFHIEDHKIMRDGLRLLLEQDHDIKCVGEAETGQHALEKLGEIDVDILILDYFLNSGESEAKEGIDVLCSIKDLYPKIAVIGHSVLDDADRIARMMNGGAMGFVSKRAGISALNTAIKTVYGGSKYIGEDYSGKFKNLKEFISGTNDVLKPTKELFSVRERDVLQLLSKGYSSKRIAKELFITEKTVETHRKNMSDKAKVKNTAELIAFASARGMVNYQ